MTADAWDECAACGHDRDDHRGGACQGYMPDQRTSRLCTCSVFEEAA